MHRNKRSNRDFSAARGYQYHYVAACIQQKKELCMSPRQMAIYWEEPSMNMRPEPTGCYSRFLKYKLPCWSHMIKKRKVTHIAAFLVDSLEKSFADIISRIAGTYLEGHISKLEGTIYLRYDTDDNTAQENESTYYDIQELLQRHGYTMTNTCIEHDCISGDVVKYIPD